MLFKIKKLNLTKMSKIYIFTQDESNHPFGQPYIAVAEDGEQLCGHFCSNFNWAKSDMDVNKKVYYEAKYSDGYELVFLPNGEYPPQEVMNKFEKLQSQGAGIKNGTEVKITFN